MNTLAQFAPLIKMLLVVVVVGISMGLCLTGLYILYR